MRRLAALLTVVLLARAGPAFAQRTVAVTIDDLPYASAVGCEPGGEVAFTRDFLAMLKAQDIPAIGFANPGNGCGEQPAAPGVLEAWLDAGFTLGSHSMTHPDINVVGIEAYEADVIAAEAVLKPMLAARGQVLTWYRHPYLRTGSTVEIRDQLENFLVSRGYRTAPITIDNSDWVFASAYAKALHRGDRKQAEEVGLAYVAYMETMTAFFEERSMAVLGYELPQVLLIHASALNKDWFPAVKRMFDARGYRFVTLDQAMIDPAYAVRDVHVGRYGMSWLWRWAHARRTPGKVEPEVPAWVTKLYEAPLERHDGVRGAPAT